MGMVVGVCWLVIFVVVGDKNKRLGEKREREEYRGMIWLIGGGGGWCYWLAMWWQWVAKREIGRETEIKEKRESQFCIFLYYFNGLYVKIKIGM